MFENIKADHEFKTYNQKGNNLDYLQNKSIVNLTTTAAKQSFNRYIQRGNQSSENQDLYFLKIPNKNLDGILNLKHNFYNSFQEVFERDATLREFSPINNRSPTIEDEKRLLKSERKPRKNLVSLKMSFLSRVASPKKAPEVAQEEALENAKFFAQIQSEKDRKLIQIRLAQMTKQCNKLVPRSSTDRKINMSAADTLLKKSIGKKNDFVSIQCSVVESATSMRNPESTRVLAQSDKFVIPSRRCSQNTISPQEFNSLYNQKLIKGRVSTRGMSPANIPLFDSPENLQFQRVNGMATMEYMSPIKNNIVHSRKISTGDFSSLKDNKVFTEKKELFKTDKDYENKKNNLFNADIENEIMQPPFVQDQEKGTLINRKPGVIKTGFKQNNFIGMNGVGIKRNKESEVSKENSIYTHLHEKKRWRMRVFQKPNKKSGFVSSRDVAQNKI